MRCVIVDDSDSFLEQARVLLERDGLSVVGVATTVGDALQRARELSPDVLLVDIDLAGESGFTVARELTSGPGTPYPVILISMYPQEDFADLVDESDALGFIAKSDLSARSVREIVAGGG